MGNRLPHCSVDNISYGVWIMKWLLRYLLKRHPEVGEEFYLRDHIKVTNAPLFMVITEWDSKELNYQFPIRTREITFKDGCIELESRAGTTDYKAKVNGSFVDIEGMNKKQIFDKPLYMMPGDDIQVNQLFHLIPKED